MSNLSFFNEKNTSVQWASFGNTLYGEFATNTNSDFVKKELKNIPIDSYNFRKNGTIPADDLIVLGLPSSSIAEEIKLNVKDWIPADVDVISEDKVKLDYTFPKYCTKVFIKVN